MDKQTAYAGSPSGKLSLRMQDIASRIWKYKFHYIVAFPALFLLLAIKVFPFLAGVYMSLIDYAVFRGLYASEWVGLKHYVNLLNDEAFRTALANTLTMKAAYAAACGATAFLLALALSAIRSSRLRTMLASLFLIPYFIPSLMIAYIAMLLLSPVQSPFFHPDVSVLTDPGLFRVALVCLGVLKTCGIPVVIALAAIGYKHASASGVAGEQRFLQTNVIPAAKAIAAFMLLQLSALLSTDFELVSSLLNPLVYSTGDMLNTYWFRHGLLSANYSEAEAVWMIQFMIQFVFVLLAYVLLRRWFRTDLFGPGSSAAAVMPTAGRSGNAAGLAIAAGYGAIALIPVYLLFVYPFFVESDSTTGVWNTVPFPLYAKQMWMCFLAVAVYAAVTVTLAYPLTIKDLPGRVLYRFFLLFVLAMEAGSVHDYLFISVLDELNPVIPYVLYSSFGIISVFVLKSVFNAKFTERKEKLSREGNGEMKLFFLLFLPRVWKPLAALCVLQFIGLWNSFYPSFLYSGSPNEFIPMLLLRDASIGAMEEIAFGDPLVLKIGAAISAPAIALFLLFRKWLTPDLLLSQTRKL